MTEKAMTIPTFNPSLTAAEREAVLAHAANAFAADIKSLDAVGQAHISAWSIGILMVKLAWASDRAALLEQRIGELEAQVAVAKATPAKPRARP